MKTHLTHLRVNGELSFADHASKFLVLCGAVAISFATGVVASGQSPSASGSSAVKNSPVTNGLFTHSGETFRVVDTASYKTAADIGSVDPSTIQQVGHGACTSCGTSCGGACGGSMMSASSCGSCGTNCGGACGRNSYLSCGPKNMNPCQPCSPYRYASVEALYMQRDDNNFNYSGLGQLDDYDDEFGSRITIGSVSDCIHGYEASFVGPFEWDSSNRLSSPFTFQPVLSNASFVPVGSTTSVLGNISDTTTILSGAESLESRYFSLDANKTLNGWEFSKLLIGGRFLNYDEEFNAVGNFQTVQSRTQVGGPAAETTTRTSNARLRNEVENRLVGLQIGLDLLYPISRFAFTDIRMRAGAFANFAEVNYDQRGTQTQVTTPTASFFDGSTSLNRSSSDDSIELAGLFELGTGIRYQLGDILSVRAGVEMWYLSGVASATQNIGGLQNPSGRASIRSDDDVLFTGLSVGAELRY